ncbi:MAG: hypothetical protein NC043_06495 [Muribaculaceae bacterium]|nr:hypothetical protein [Muribaculaceae bacterium]
MEYFWIGIAVCVVGVLIRNFYRIKYIIDYKSNARTPMGAQEMRQKYRPLIFVGLAVQIAGVVIACLSL